PHRRGGPYSSAGIASAFPRTAAGAMTRPPTRTTDDAWALLRPLTAARIGLARSGASLATGPLLEFRLAHARARDAVHAPLDEAKLLGDLAALNHPVVAVSSAAADR